MKTGHRLAGLLAVLMVSTAITAPAMAQALPTGGTVKAGSAQIGKPANGAVTVTQSSQRAVVNWQSFNVGAGNSVTFSQPNANAATLNRVTGSGASNVAGSITANGKVYLVNPNGIQITPTGTIDAKGGFVASTLGVSNSDFMSGKDKFTGNGASKGVVNQGAITTGQGGTVALIGGSAANEGTITAPLGKVALGAGEAATLDINGGGFLQVTIPSDATDASGKPLVSNSGVINAAGGTVELKAAAVRDAMRQAVNMSGTIQARSVSGHDGQVVLGDGNGTTVVSGTVDVSGASQGGRIDVSGQQVQLRGASLDASGGDQGGLVRIGGAFQGGAAQNPATAQTQKYVTRFGASPAIASADTTSVDADSRISVAATGANGTGGTAIVWSNLNTTELAVIDAHGGGAGGAIEVSSHNAVQAIDLSRIRTGTGGSLLLDPKNINIVDDPGDGSVTFDTTQDYAFADSIGGTLTLSTQDVMGVLSTGTNLTLQASNDITWTTGGAAGSGTLGHLTLEAGRSVIFNIATQLDFLQGTVTVIANDTAAAGVIDADRDSGAANLSIIASGSASNGGIAAAINGGYDYTPSSPSSFLTLKLLDGAGNTNHAVGNLSITQADFSDIELYAVPAAQIQFNDQIFLARNLTLTGNIQIVQGSTFGFNVDDSFTWTNEYTAGISTLAGSTLAFDVSVNNHTTTLGRIRPGDTDAVRLTVAGDTVPYTAVYGDSIPTASHAVDTTIDPNSAIQSFGTGDTASGVVRTTGISISFAQNPGDSVGTYTGQIFSGGSFFRSGLHASYLADVSTYYATLPTLNITPRPVTVMAMDASGFTYGQPNGALAVTLLPDESNGGATGAVGVLSTDNPIPLVSFAGLSGTQSLDDLGGLQFAFGSHAPGGTHSYTVTGFDNPNYAVNLVSGTRSAQLTVSPALLTPTVSAGSYTYGSPDPVVSLAGIINGDTVLPLATVTGVSGTQTMTDAGSGNYAFDAHVAAGTRSYTLTGVGGSDGGNYTLDTSGTISASLAIAPKALNYAGGGGNVTSTYGTLASLDLTLNGVLSGDDVAAAATVTGTSGAVTLGARTQVGTYTVSPSGLSGAQAGNYSISSASSFTLTINPLGITYTAPSGTVNYGTVFAGTVALNGVLTGDDVTAALGIKSGGVTNVYDNHANAATYQTLPILGGAQAANYNVTGTPGTLIISPLPLDYVLHGGTINYGAAALPAVDLSGILFGDDVSAVVGTDAPGGLTISTSVGTYNASVNGLTGAKAANYTLGSGNATSTLTITPKQLGFNSTSSTSIYGDSTAPNSAVTLTGLVTTGDAIAIHPQLTITDANGNAVIATLDSSSLGSTIASLANTLDAGSYTVSVTGIASSDGSHPVSNYSFTPATAQAITVSKRQLTAGITDAPYSIVYGSTVAFGLGITLTGFAPGEAGIGHYTMVDANGAAVALGDPRDYTLGSSGSALIAGTNAGSYTVTVDTNSFITQGTAKLSNYIITNNPSTTLTITPKPLNWTVNNVTSVYGTLAAPVTSLRNIFGSDNVFISDFALTNGLGQAVAFNDRVTGSNTYTIGAAGLGGAQAGNYMLATTGTNVAGTLTVTPRPVTWSITDTSDTYGSANALRDMGTVTLNGVLTGDAVGAVTGFYGPNGPGNPQPTIDMTTNAGAYYTYVSAITGAGLTLNNYVLANSVDNHRGTFTVNPEPLTIKVADASIVYGSTPSFTGSSMGVLSGVLYNGDHLTVDGYSYDFGAGNVGTYALGGGAHVSSNYTVTMVGGTVTITPLPLTYNVTDLTWVYGDYTDAQVALLRPAITFARTSDGADFTGLIGSDYSSALTLAGVPVTLNQHSDALNYTVAVTGISAPNFILSGGHDGTISITPRPLILRPATAVYGSAPVFSFSNVLAGDSLGLLADATGTTGQTYTLSTYWNGDGSLRTSSGLPPVDTYSVAGVLSASAGTRLANYSLASSTTTLAITPKPITITSMATVQGVYGDDIYFIDPAGQKQAALSVYGDGSTDHFVYNGTVTYSGLVQGGDAAFITPYMLNFSTLSAGAGTSTWFADGSFKTLALKGGASCTAVGCVNLNYVLANPGVVNPLVTVTPATITYSIGNTSGAYGSTIPVSVTLTGVLAHDVDIFTNTVAIVPTVGFFDSDLHAAPLATFAVGGGGAARPVDSSLHLIQGNTPYIVTFSGSSTGILAGSHLADLMSLSGAVAGNYTFVRAPGSAGTVTVTPKPLTYTTASATNYAGVGAIAGSLDDLGDYTLSGLLQGDVVGVTLRLAATDPKANGATFALSSVVGLSAGEYQVLVTSLIGPQSGNYSIAVSGNTPGILTSVDVFGDLNGLGFLGSNNAGTNIVDAANAVRAAERNGGNTVGTTTSIDLSDITNQMTGFVQAPNSGTLANVDLQTLGTPTIDTYLKAPAPVPPPTPPATGSGTSDLTTSTDTSTQTSGGCASSTICVLTTPAGVIITGGASATACAAGGAVCSDGSANYEVNNTVEPTGVSLNDNVTAGVTNTATENCGAGTCTQTAHVDVSVGTQVAGGVMLSSTGVDLTQSASVTAGVTFSASNGISGDFGSVDSQVGTTIGGLGVGAGASGSYDNGVLKIGISFSLEVGIGLDVDLNFGINVGAWSDFFGGSNTTYTAFADPEAAREREATAIGLVQNAQYLAEQENQFVQDVLAGKYNANPQNIAEIARQFKVNQAGLTASASAQGFQMAHNANGSFDIRDNTPPAIKTTTVHNEGLLEAMGL